MTVIYSSILCSPSHSPTFPWKAASSSTWRETSWSASTSSSGPWSSPNDPRCPPPGSTNIKAWNMIQKTELIANAKGPVKLLPVIFLYFISLWCTETIKVKNKVREVTSFIWFFSPLCPYVFKFLSVQKWVCENVTIYSKLAHLLLRILLFSIVIYQIILSWVKLVYVVFMALWTEILDCIQPFEL